MEVSRKSTHPRVPFGQIGQSSVEGMERMQCVCMGLPWLLGLVEVRIVLLDEVSAQGFVLALHGELRGQEEVLVARCRYLIRSAGLHISMVLPKHVTVNMF